MVLAPAGPAPERGVPHIVLTEESRADWFSWRAAGLVLLAMFGVLLLIRRYSAPPPPPPPAATDYLNFLTNADAGIPATLAHGWIDDSTRHPSEAVAAVRVGARMVDLEAAALSRRRTGYAAWPGVPTAIWAVFHDIPYVNWPVNPDAHRAVRLESERVSHFAGELTGLFEDVPLGGTAAWDFRRVQNEAWDWVNLDDVAAAHEASRVLPSDRVALGSWLEAARIAALQGDSAFFASPEVRREALRAPALAKLSDEQREALRNVARAVGNVSRQGAPALEEQLTLALWSIAK